ncbi:MAG: aldo/keto reductase, partial [Acidobacteria bacterium]|nr:aldo/keto reductase [Acidobacteriota bacterium]
VPIPGTTKLSRLDENIASTRLELSPNDLAEITEASSRIDIEGDRYPQALEKMTGL